MARPVDDAPRWTTRLLVAFVLAIVAYWVVTALLGFVFALIRIALFLALFGVIAWVVLVGGRGKTPRS